MRKPFDVEFVQSLARYYREQMVGKNYIHHKGDLYYCSRVDVDEETGKIRVGYDSVALGYQWSRTLDNFQDLIPRFKEEP